MFKVLYADDKLLTLGYVGFINTEVGGVLFDGLFEGTVSYPNGEKRIYEGEGHAIFINETCHIAGEFAGLVKSKVYESKDDIPEIVMRTLDHLENQHRS